jgi:hypothetical protein
MVDVLLGDVPRRDRGDTGCDRAGSVCQDPGPALQTDC